jgi:hypothetical protein
MINEVALIGYTGFVGSTLLREKKFDALYNSSNISEIAGRHFSKVVCAGVSAVKWWANNNPDQDAMAISSLRTNLEAATIDHLVLVSTVDVYPDPRNVTEKDIPDYEINHAYGRHRRELEIWAVSRFEKCTIVRLPGLFGFGLKKNIIYDLIAGNQTEKISPLSRLQWYPMRRFSQDLDRVLEAQVDLVNIAPAPVETRTIVNKMFPDRRIGPAEGVHPLYDMRTVHSSLLGGEGHYHLNEGEVLAHLTDFVEAERS